MSMGMGMSFGHYQRVEHRLEQMQKLELRQELKLVLRLLLKLVQALAQTQCITLEQIQEIRQAVAGLADRDVSDLAHETIRRGGLRNAFAVSETLHAVARFAPDAFGTLTEFANAVTGAARREENRRDRHVQHQGPVLALRLILREPEPPFLGGCVGTPENLAQLLDAVPQRSDAGDVRWVLGGGWAVELLTGRSRPHHDIDTVVMARDPLYLDTDAVHTDNYFGILSCTRLFLARHCTRRVTWTHGGRTHDVVVLTPEFLFLSKFLCTPRDKDWADVVALVETFAETWDLVLLGKLLKRNQCSFTRTRELMRVLRLRKPEQILAHLRSFWS